MKVKSIKEYHDTQLGRLVKPDEVLEVADARGKILLDAKVAEELTTPEVVTESANKKKVPVKKVNK